MGVTEVAARDINNILGWNCQALSWNQTYRIGHQ